MPATKPKAQTAAQRGTRFDVALAFPQNEFQVPGLPVVWWSDSTHPHEPQAKHRLSQLEPFVRGCNGSIAVFRVDFEGSRIVSERLILRAGKDTSRTPQWKDVLPMNQSAAGAFLAAADRWRDAGNPDVVLARLQAAAIKPRRTTRRARYSLGQNLAFTLFILAFGGALAGMAATYQTIEGRALRSDQPKADPGRYDRATFSVPNDEGGCDRLSFNNRTGTTVFTGKGECGPGQSGRRAR